MTMTSNRPYLMRAIYDWIIDNNYTPYVLLDSHWPGVLMTKELLDAEDGQVVLNISPMATRDFTIGNDKLSFLTRFDGEVCTISAPIGAVRAIYAQENSQGMMFEEEHEEYHEYEETEDFYRTIDSQQDQSKNQNKKTDRLPEKKRPTLKIVK